MQLPIMARTATIHARIIANPVAASGRDRDRPLQQAAGVFASNGWTVSWRWTEWAGHAETLARAAAAEGATVVVVAGGDGTVNEVTNGLVGSDTALAILPAGTGNVLAAQLGLVGVPTPLHRPDPPTAAAQLCRGRYHRVDVGFARPRGKAGRHFLLWAGIGLDAAVAHELEGDGRDLKRIFGPVAFGAIGLKTVLDSVGSPAVIRTDGQRVRDRLLMGVIANIPLYAGAIDLIPDARMDDGLLDVALFHGSSVWATVSHISSVLAGRREAGGPRSDRRASRARVVSARPLPVHLDAEPYGSTPVSFDVRHRSLCLLVPPTAPASLFVGSGEPL